MKLKNYFAVFYEREYRPAYIFRIPIYFIGLYFAIKAKHPRFFSLVNPSVPWGFMNESKSLVYQLLCNPVYPQSVIIEIPSSLFVIITSINSEKMKFPLIIKPDGDSVRGENVYMISDEKDLERRISMLPRGKYLLQKYIDGEEYSIYYAHHPNDKQGVVLGITKKIFPTLLGDGYSTVGELIKNHKRYRRYYTLFHDKYHVDMIEVIPKGIVKQIASIGNHSKGSLFLDWSHYSSDILTTIFDGLFKSDEEIYLYRVDLKTENRDQLLLGKFVILEANCGVFAEPTYMYDPKYKLIDAYKQIYKVRKIAFDISKYHHDVKKYSYISFQEGWRYAKKFLFCHF